MFSQEQEQSKDVCSHSVLTPHGTGSSGRCGAARRLTERHTHDKDAKPCLFAEDLVVCIENPKESKNK